MFSQLSPKQFALLAIYRKHVALDEATYREVLLSNTGMASAKEFTAYEFEQVMSTLEAIAADRLERGVIRSFPVRDSLYWRRRFVSPNANARLVFKIRQLWSMLCDYLPQERRTEAYLAGIIRQAEGQPLPQLTDSQGRICWDTLRTVNCRNLIAALKDRLTYAVKRPA